MRQNSKVVARIITILGGLVVALLFTTIQNASAYAGTHWKNHVVYVENHASGFPVRQAAEDLDNHNGLDLRVVRHCPKKTSCIKVRTVWDFRGRVIGKTIVWISKGQTVGAEVNLESKWGKNTTYRQRRALACHELGHAIGLDHSRGKTCMNMVIGKYTKPTINKRQRNQLRRWY